MRKLCYIDEMYVLKMYVQNRILIPGAGFLYSGQSNKFAENGGRSVQITQSKIYRANRRKTIMDRVLRYRWLYVMLIPGILYLILFKYSAIVNNVIAFKDYQIFRGIWGSPWCGWDNFNRLWGSENFHRIFRNTLIISGYKLVFGFTAPILFALMLNEVENVAYKRTIQTIAYLPHFLSWVIIGSLASNLFSVNDG